MLKSAGAYALHVITATTVPFVALLSTGVIYGLLKRVIPSVAASPQQFYSEHLFAAVSVTGLWLAYVVCDTFTIKGALWVWLPFGIVLLVRVISWQSAYSVLVRPDIISHFFTANCQIGGWPEPDFASRCADKLFLTPLAIGGLAYSAGATIHLMRHRKAELPANA